MKKIIFLLLIAASASAQAVSRTTVCLGVAELAEAYAEVREVGVTEKELVTRATAMFKVPAQLAAVKNVISYIYTLRVSSKDARRDVYLQCMAAGLGYPE